MTNSNKLTARNPGHIKLHQTRGGSRSRQRATLGSTMLERLPRSAAEARFLVRRRGDERLYRRLADVWFIVDVLRSRNSVDRQRLALAPGGIDAEQLATEVELERHSKRADEFFGGGRAPEESKASADAHMLKPFSDPIEASNHFSAWAALVADLQLARGMRVLDFGCGNGWISRLLIQLGCTVVLCDVSDTALDIARESFHRSPPLTTDDGSPPEFLVFDGHRLDLQDGSIDRILCFDAFHHVPNHEVVLAEMHRVLADGGIAGFHEPGPDHSRKPSSQFEMVNFGFLERDIRIKEIERHAKEAGFDHLRLSLDAPVMKGLSVRDYDRFLRWCRIPITFRRLMWHWATGTRIFYLTKNATGPADSRQGLGLDAHISMSETSRTQDERTFLVRIENTGTLRWLDSGAPSGGVRLGAHLYDRSRTLVDFDYLRWSLPGDGVDPGDVVEIEITLPEISAEQHVVLDLVAENVTWFAKFAATAVDVPASV